MKNQFVLISILLSIILLISGFCDKKSPANMNTNTKNSKMTIKIGSKTFEATLYDNETATAFKAMLPLTLKMTELNDNEKYADLANKLPTHSLNPKTIQNGDLMIYGSKTLVLFYKTFSTPYSYTKLGRVTDTTGLADVLGDEDVTISFELH